MDGAFSHQAESVDRATQLKAMQDMMIQVLGDRFALKLDPKNTADNAKIGIVDSRSENIDLKQYAAQAVGDTGFYLVTRKENVGPNNQYFGAYLDALAKTADMAAKGDPVAVRGCHNGWLCDPGAGLDVAAPN